MYAITPTPPEWAATAISDLPALLADHLHCERKAAASALSLVRQYPDRTELVLHLSRLAHEETAHMVEVGRRLQRAKAPATRDVGDPYAQGLRALVRKKEPGRQVDMLLVSGLIEARSAERLELIGEALEDSDPELARFYRSLTEAEYRHRDLFLSLARPLVDEATLSARIAELCAAESELVAGLPWGPRVH